MSDQPSATSSGSDARLRTGPELIKATIPFEVERRWQTWLLFLTTLVALATTITIAVLVRPWPFQILAGAIAGLVQVRLFIFYHDALHGALFKKSPIGHVCMSLTGIYLMSVRSVWQETHDYHHQHNGKLAATSVGSYPIVTVANAARMTPAERRRYTVIRHPLTIALGCLTVFFVGLVLSAFRRSPRKHWLAPLAALVHVALLVGAVSLFGWTAGLCAVAVPAVVSMAMGSYLFYAQHNFPGATFQPRESWSFTSAALGSSSYFEMGRVMRWFTGEIGHHHVHHLNHRIPFYRLREAMVSLPELQHPGKTTWALRDIISCLSLHVWDPDQQRMITRSEYAHRPAPVPAPDQPEAKHERKETTTIVSTQPA